MTNEEAVKKTLEKVKKVLKKDLNFSMDYKDEDDKLVNYMKLFISSMASALYLKAIDQLTIEEILETDETLAGLRSGPLSGS